MQTWRWKRNGQHTPFCGMVFGQSGFSFHFNSLSIRIMWLLDIGYDIGKNKRCTVMHTFTHTHTHSLCRSNSNAKIIIKINGYAKAYPYIILTRPSLFLNPSWIFHTNSGPAHAVCLLISKCWTIGLLSIGFCGGAVPLLNFENIVAAGISPLSKEREREREQKSN